MRVAQPVGVVLERLLPRHQRRALRWFARRLELPREAGVARLVLIDAEALSGP